MKILSKKVILFIFFLVLFVELVWVMAYFVKKTRPQTQFIGSGVSTSTTSFAFTLSLDPPRKSVKVGETFSVTIMVDAGGKKLSGVDAVLFYDANKVVPEGKIIPGTLFPSYPLQKISTSAGKISITGTMTSNSQQPFTGKGIFATLNFKAMSAGEALFAFDFMRGSTIDSNFVEFSSGKDLLESVSNGRYTISR